MIGDLKLMRRKHLSQKNIDHLNNLHWESTRMSLLKYKRLVQLIRERHTTPTITLAQFRRAIMECFGTDEKTITMVIKRAQELQLVTNEQIYKVTSEDINEFI